MGKTIYSEWKKRPVRDRDPNQVGLETYTDNNKRRK